jgi:outer membrane protein assembly factor BamB
MKAMYALLMAVCLWQCVNAIQLEYAWNTTTTLQTSELLVATSDTFYFRGGSAIYAVDAASGVTLRTITYPTIPLPSSLPLLAAAEGGLLYFAYGNMEVAYRDTTLLWNKTTVRGNSQTVLTLDSTVAPTLIALSHNDGHVVVRRTADGEAVFRYDANIANGLVPYTAVFASGVLIVVDSANIVAFNASTGVGLWTYTLPGGVSTQIVASPTYAVVASGSAEGGAVVALTVFNVINGHVAASINQTYQYPASGTAPSPFELSMAPSGDVVLLSTNYQIFAVEVPSLTLRWIRTGSMAAEPAAFANGFALFVTQETVYGVEMASGATAFPGVPFGPPYYPAESQAGSIAVASSGPYVATSIAAENIQGNPYVVYRAAWRVPQHANVTMSTCQNGPDGPCKTGCKPQVSSALCVAAYPSQSVGPSKVWFGSSCSLTADGRQALVQKLYVGTACSIEGAVLQYETVQYVGECVINEAFQSSSLQSCE